jgi:hypothetical protein
MVIRIDGLPATTTFACIVMDLGEAPWQASPAGQERVPIHPLASCTALADDLAEDDVQMGSTQVAGGP